MSYDWEAHNEGQEREDDDYIGRLDEAAKAANLRHIIDNMRASAYSLFHKVENGEPAADANRRHVAQVDTLADTLSMMLQVAGLEYRAARAVKRELKVALRLPEVFEALEEGEALRCKARAEMRGSIDHVPTDATPF